MRFSQSYVLVLGQQSEDIQLLESLLRRLRCPMVVVASIDQVVEKATQAPPYLVLLSCSAHACSQDSVYTLRRLTQRCGTTILALTDCNAPSWLYQEDNPGFDGFLVKPLSGDVLVSLVQSAWAKQVCHSVSG